MQLILLLRKPLWSCLFPKAANLFCSQVVRIPSLFVYVPIPLWIQVWGDPWEFQKIICKWCWHYPLIQVVWRAGHCKVSHVPDHLHTMLGTWRAQGWRAERAFPLPKVFGSVCSYSEEDSYHLREEGIWASASSLPECRPHSDCRKWETEETRHKYRYANAARSGLVLMNGRLSFIIFMWCLNIFVIKMKFKIQPK